MTACVTDQLINLTGSSSSSSSQVDEAEVKFTAAGTAPSQAAKPTALMVLNEEQLAADKLGCTMGE